MPKDPGSTMGVPDMRALRRRFLGPFLYLFAFYGVTALLELARMRGQGRVDNAFVALIFFAAFVLPLQAYAITRVSVHQALIQKTSLRATFMAGWKVGVLPYVLLFFCMVFIATTGGPRGETELFGTWALVHVLPNGVFLILARASDAASSTWRKPW